MKTYTVTFSHGYTLIVSPTESYSYKAGSTHNDVPERVIEGLASKPKRTDSITENKPSPAAGSPTGRGSGAASSPSEG